MEPRFYLDVLCPLQDQALRCLNERETGFCLTGGTAASRGFLHHRFSDDLGLFVNDDARFGLWSQRVISGLTCMTEWRITVLQRDERFVRLNLSQAAVEMKIELVNDVPAHLGDIRLHPVLGRLDSPENILANKLSALVDREEPRDLADVWGFCCRMRLSIDEALTGAQSKAAGLFPADIARILLSATSKEWELVRWSDAPPVDQFLDDIRVLGEHLLLGARTP